MHAGLNACMRKTFGCMYAEFGCKVCGNGWVQSMRLLGAKYAVVGCKSMETFGCMYAVVGCKSSDTFGCMYAEVGCKFHTAEGLPDSR